MGTLGGFPNPPALWLRRAKPGYANASNGNPDLKHLAPRSEAKRGEVAERSEAGEGLPRFKTEGSGPWARRCYWEGSQTRGTTNPPYLPLASLGLARSGGTLGSSQFSVPSVVLDSVRALATNLARGSPRRGPQSL